MTSSVSRFTTEGGFHSSVAESRGPPGHSSGIRSFGIYAVVCFIIATLQEMEEPNCRVNYPTVCLVTVLLGLLLGKGSIIGKLWLCHLLTSYVDFLGAIAHHNYRAVGFWWRFRGSGK